MNSQTAFIDGSAIYGSSEFRARSLRMNPNEGPPGMMLFTGFELLPVEGAGDQRFTAQPTLMAMHTLFLREHNRLAKAIAKKMTFSKAMSVKERDEAVFQARTDLLESLIKPIHSFVFRRHAAWW